MTKPMSDERLAEIREEIDLGTGALSGETATELLAEVERLRAERERVVDALSDVGRTAEAASGDLEDGVNAELLALGITVGVAEGAVKRVRELHQPIAAHLDDPDDDDNLITACSGCEVPYPCPTIRALDGTEAGR